MRLSESVLVSNLWEPADDGLNNCLVDSTLEFRLSDLLENCFQGPFVARAEISLVAGELAVVLVDRVVGQMRKGILHVLPLGLPKLFLNDQLPSVANRTSPSS